MSNLSNLVQVSSGSWVNPDDVKRIYTCERTDGPPTTYIVCTGLDYGGLIMIGMESHDHLIISDWPVDRIANALGLIDADTLDAQFDQ